MKLGGKRPPGDNPPSLFDKWHVTSSMIKLENWKLDPGFLKGGEGGGVQIWSTNKKGGGGGRRGPILGPMLKRLHRGTKGGSRLPGHPPPDPPLINILHDLFCS